MQPYDHTTLLRWSKRLRFDPEFLQPPAAYSRWLQNEQDVIQNHWIPGMQRKLMITTEVKILTVNDLR